MSERKYLSVMKKDKIKSFELIRAISMIGIILFHYSYNYVEYNISGSHIGTYKTANTDFGSIFVAMFFMMSGAVLYYNYGDKIKIGNFYFKRWLSIFPMFYSAWFLAYLAKVNELGTWFWGGSRRNFIYTILGMDGYFLNPGVNINYYTLGEWFLGAIIFLYLLFPVLRFIYKVKIARYLFSGVLIIAYLANLYNDWFLISDGRNMITCVMNFWIGFLIIDLFQYFKDEMEGHNNSIGTQPLISIAGLVFGLILCFIKLKFPSTLMATLTALCFTEFLIYYGDKVMRVEWISSIVGLFAKYSFGMYLVHHVILYAFMKPYAATTLNIPMSIWLFIVVLTIIFFTGAVLCFWGEFIGKQIKRIIKL